MSMDFHERIVARTIEARANKNWHSSVPSFSFYNGNYHLFGEEAGSDWADFILKEIKEGISLAANAKLDYIEFAVPPGGKKAHAAIKRELQILIEGFDIEIFGGVRIKISWSA
jgi:hypothetical protein